MPQAASDVANLPAGRLILPPLEVAAAGPASQMDAEGRHRRAARVNTRMPRAMNVAAKRPTNARLRNASPVVLPIPQMSCKPVPRWPTQAVAHQRQGVSERQEPWRTRSGLPGRAPIGNSAPAKNQGRIATAGVAPMYSSCFGIRLASVSATPYMKTANGTTAATNQSTPEALSWKSSP